MSFRLTALAAAALACAGAPAAHAFDTTLRATFQNASGMNGRIKATNPNDGTRSDDAPSFLGAHSAYSVPDILVSLGIMTPTEQWNFFIVLDDGRECGAWYYVNTNSCVRQGLNSKNGAKCDSASSWSGTTCELALKISD